MEKAKAHIPVSIPNTRPKNLPFKSGAAWSVSVGNIELSGQSTVLRVQGLLVLALFESSLTWLATGRLYAEDEPMHAFSATHA